MPQFMEIHALHSLSNSQVEEKQEALQQRDDWDGTPLYYAAFTGNQEMVKYLLSRGAVCETKASLTTLTGSVAMIAA